MLFSVKMLFSLTITLLIFGTMFTTLISSVFNNRDERPAVSLYPAPKIISKLCDVYRDVKPAVPLLPAPKTKGSSKRRKSPVENVMIRYSQNWTKHQENTKNFRSLLRSTCQGFTKAIVTQGNTPVGTQIKYAYKKAKPLTVSSGLFDTFVQRNPFSNKTWDTCSVVGNGGILLNSNCGEMIDSAQFVIRCNLPPLENCFLKDVGSKTDLVTANPSILVDRFNRLEQRRSPFTESMRRYNDALMLLPAFSYSHNTPLSMRAFYAIEDFKSPIRTVFLNPEYVQNLTSFWRSKGLKKLPTTGFMMTTLALELCTNVHLYGFWPFNQHPQSHQPLTNHYYDNRQWSRRVHELPVEFDHLLRLHEQGILKIHLGECQPSSR